MTATPNEKWSYSVYEVRYFIHKKSIMGFDKTEEKTITLGTWLPDALQLVEDLAKEGIDAGIYRTQRLENQNDLWLGHTPRY